MTVTKFKYDMQRGLGRCYLELKNCSEIEKYRKTVLWGCLHPIAFDAQCEGTRACYLYRLLSLFPDRDYFVEKIAEKYRVISGRDTWFFQQLTELLSFFCDDGFRTAKEALSVKYDVLYSSLLNNKNLKGYDFRRDNFEFLSIVFLSQRPKEIPEKLIADFGNLFLKTSYGLEWHFDWFLCCLEKAIGKKKLIEELKKHKNIPEWKSFYDSYLQAKQEEGKETPKENLFTAENLKKSVDLDGEISRARKIRFSRCADDAEKRKLAELIEMEPAPEKKAEMLKAVWNENYPGNHRKLIGYAESDCEALSAVAKETLANCRSETVYRYAKEKAEMDKRDPTVIEMLLSNYRAADQSFLLSALSDFPVEYDEKSGWHGIVLHILKVQDFGVFLPKDFFVWIYENSLCSCCREYAVRYMGKRRWLSHEVIIECLYDSNDDIVSYAKKRFIKKTTIK